MNDEGHLPEPLPGNPMPLFMRWFREARERAVQPNPDAMVLATVDGDGSPSARVVLCKRIEEQAGYIVFFTNRLSRKGRELAAHPRAATVMHWDALQRQVRIEGRVLASPDAESDSYFASRALLSRLSAWASEQSAPLASRQALSKRITDVASRFGLSLEAAEGSVPRPPHWGGYRLWIDSIELWMEGAGRTHDRAVWQRSLTPLGTEGFATGPLQATRLNP